MSLLDDAQELLNRGPGDPEYLHDAPCPYCGFLPHQEDCPWLAMPKIVAALRAAEHVAALMVDKPLDDVAVDPIPRERAIAALAFALDIPSINAGIFGLRGSTADS